MATPYDAARNVVAGPRSHVGLLRFFGKKKGGCQAIRHREGRFRGGGRRASGESGFWKGKGVGMGNR